jgi:archaellum biogenesis ATPase FlaH
MTREPFTASPDVPVLERPPAPQRGDTDAPELARIKSALDAIPNNSTKELDYDAWRNIVFAIHYATEGSDAGLALAHEFSARSAKYDADFLDNRVWPYIQSDRGGSVITERTIFARAAQEGWQDPAALDDFEILEPAAAPENRDGKPRFEFVQAGAFAAGKPPGWIIKNVLPAAELGMVYGESGSGKSFFVLDMLCSIAQGTPWRDLKTAKGRVAYIAAEGAAGVRNRLKAYCALHGVDLFSLDLFILGKAPNFMVREDIIDLVNAMRASGRFDVVVVDTLARVIPGANENAGEDVGRALDHCKTIHEVTGALVILVHHSGKDAAKGARGWSGVRAACDVEIEVLRAEHDRVATVTKLKDGEDGAEFGFKLNTIEVDLDDDGESVTSCVVEYTAAVAKDKRKNEPRTGIPKLAWQVVIDLQGLDGGAPTSTQVIDEIVARMPHDEASNKRDTRRQHALRALTGLVDKGTVVLKNDRVELPGGGE